MQVLSISFCSLSEYLVLVRFAFNSVGSLDAMARLTVRRAFWQSRPCGPRNRGKWQQRRDPVAFLP